MKVDLNQKKVMKMKHEQAGIGIYTFVESWEFWLIS